MSQSTNFIHLQSSLLTWIKHHQERTINQIQQACVDLLNSVGSDARSPLFKIFFPLVRMGFVEFAKNGKYFVSMPVTLFYPQSSTAVAINLTDKQKELLRGRYQDFDEDCFGVIRVKSFKAGAIAFCGESECSFSQPDVQTLLGHFPTISRTVLNFEHAMVASHRVEYYDTTNHRWSRVSQEPGLFRISTDAQKLFLTINDSVRIVPDRNINPEGRPLVECYLGMQHSRDCIKYDCQTGELRISKITIPMLIERLLRLASLDVPYAVQQLNFSTTFPSITNGMLKEIQRIFEYNCNEQSN